MLFFDWNICNMLLALYAELIFLFYENEIKLQIVSSV